MISKLSLSSLLGLSVFTITLLIVSSPLSLDPSIAFAAIDSLYMTKIEFIICFLILESLVSLYVLLRNKLWDHFDVLIVTLLSIIFYSFLLIESPTVPGWDPYYHMATLNFFLNRGFVITDTFINLSWVGMYSLYAVLFAITGLTLFDIMKWVWVILTCLVGVLIYLLYLSILKSREYSFLAFLLFLGGNFAVNRIIGFNPQTLALVFALMFLLILSMKTEANRSVFLLILGFLLVITHPITLVWVLITVFILAFFEKDYTLPLIITIMMMTWMIFVAVLSTKSIIFHFVHLSLLDSRKSYLPLYVQRYLMDYPLWAQLTRSTWIFLITSLDFLAIYKLHRNRKCLDKSTRIMISSTVGLMILAIPLIFIVSGEFSYKLLLFGSIPACYFASLAFSGKVKYCTLLSIFLIFILLPTFYINNPKLYQLMTHKWEENGFLFMNQHIKVIDDLKIFCGYDDSRRILYYLPGTNIGNFISDAWNPAYSDLFLKRFKNGDIEADIYLVSFRTKIRFYSLYNIGDDEFNKVISLWRKSKNLVYSNGLFQIYAN